MYPTTFECFFFWPAHIAYRGSYHLVSPSGARVSSNLVHRGIYATRNICVRRRNFVDGFVQDEETKKEEEEENASREEGEKQRRSRRKKEGGETERDDDDDDDNDDNCFSCGREKDGKPSLILVGGRRCSRGDSKNQRGDFFE